MSIIPEDDKCKEYQENCFPFHRGVDDDSNIDRGGGESRMSDLCQLMDPFFW